MMKPTLLILAAGMGSRYGGLKQVDPVGPNDEAIIDYSIYDAIRAGYGKVVFVIRQSFAGAFQENFEQKLKGRISTEYVFQELDSFVPSGLAISDERKKPWGTGHAVLVARDAINEPFVVINADDFYGETSYNLIRDYLVSQSASPVEHYSMVGYKLKHTLSEHGFVSRGVCTADELGFLKTVTERTHIEKKGDEIIFLDESGQPSRLTGNEVVSMNIWGFLPSFFDHLERFFNRFVTENASNPKGEFYIPYVVNELISQKLINLKVLESREQWFGVTYQEDRLEAVKTIRQLITNGTYPEKLWN
jgi:UTP-glucose-1-phosphate uridylyltransferase